MDTIELINANGWKVGDRLIGDEGYGPTVIKITAIGESNMLAKCISHDMKTTCGVETNWSLVYRKWKLYDPADLELV